MIKELLQAYRGKWLWYKMRRKYGAGDWPSRYILFPEDDDNYNAWGILLLPFFLKKKRIDKLMIIVCNTELRECCNNIVHWNKHVIFITKEEMDSLIRLAALVPMGNEWTIVSTKKPYDTGAERLLGKNGVTYKELVWYDVYQLAEDPSIVEESKASVTAWRSNEVYELYRQQAEEVMG